MNFNILDLPLELITNILSLVPTKDLLLNVSLVNKYFYELSKNPSVHRNVTFSPFCSDQNQKEEAKKFLRNAICVEKLFINWNESFHVLSNSRDFESMVDCDEFLSELIEHENLKVLEVCKQKVTVSTKCIAKLGKSKWWKKLRRISMRIGPNKNPLARVDFNLALERLAASGLFGNESKILSSIYLLRLFTLTTL